MVQGKTLGSTLRKLREERGWSQAQLAMKSDVPRSNISLIELGRLINPRADVLLKLASALNIHVEELYQAAGYIKEVRIPYSADQTSEQILEDLKLGIRRLEKKIKEQGGGGHGKGP